MSRTLIFILFVLDRSNRFIQDDLRAVWSIPYVSVTFFPSLKENFIAYRSSKVSSRPDCIFEIYQLWQSGFSWLYSNSCRSSSFKLGIIKISQSSHNMYSNNILNFQESTTILNCCTKKDLETYWIHHVWFFSTFRNLCQHSLRLILNKGSLIILWDYFYHRMDDIYVCGGWHYARAPEPESHHQVV